MKNLFKLMLLTITMFIAGSSFALAGNDNDSIQILEKANQGDPFAQRDYAYRLYKASKKEEAKEWYEASARQGIAYSQTVLGIFYSKGVGCKRDYKSAINGMEKPQIAETVLHASISSQRVICLENPKYQRQSSRYSCMVQTRHLPAKETN